MDILIDIKNFRPLLDCKFSELNIKGLYAIRIKDITILPSLFKDEIISMETNLIYIGKGERTIYKRLFEECQGKRHGTFFRGIGSLLGFKPEKGSLIGKSNQNNYRFSKNDKEKIVDWMNNNLTVNFVKIESNIKQIESKLIEKYCPILNTTHNPNRSKMLAEVRESCRKYALSE